MNRLRTLATSTLLLAAGALGACRASATDGGTTVNAPRPASDLPALRGHVAIDLLALDLTTCGRCKGTEAGLDRALAKVSDLLAREGTTVEVRKTIVRTADQARALRFESSPTIRVDGRDIAMELRESECRDCGDLCGGADGVLCRVWVWHGREYVDAPEDMIVEGVLRAHREGPAPAPPAPFVLPANLERYFAGRERVTSSSPCCEPGCCGPRR